MTQQTAAPAADKTKHQRSISVDDPTWERVEKAAETLRKRYGTNETASSVVRRMIALGLGQIERTGDLMIIG